MRILTVARWLPLLILGLSACGGPQKAGKKGGVCFRDDDCALGLVCAIPEGATARVCTDDVGGIISEVDAGIAYGGASSAGSGAGGAAGQVAYGGAPGAGGVAATGGAPASGGTPGMGGAAAAMGGAASGGAPAANGGTGSGGV